MGSISVTSLMRLINSFSIEEKLEVLGKVSESIRLSYQTKEDTKDKLLDELFGSWSDVNDDLVDDILNRR